jgi:hypothetical protein
MRELVSGLGPSDPEAGLLFSVTATPAGGAVDLAFSEEGSYPYFCACPGHVARNMRAAVYVAPVPTPVEPATWGRIKQLFSTR